MPQPDRHVFVCLNERPAGGKPSCGGGAGPAVFAALQRHVGQRPELWGKVAITSCGCLGPCFEGPTLVVYPDAVWYVGVAAADAEEIVTEHLMAGRPVARLRHHFGDSNDGDPG
ncbi:MAG TPA: (2Fe-2S) ferredoxin domain-containing protein [Polyangia bacterium]